jgi:hypothetical protein
VFPHTYRIEEIVHIACMALIFHDEVYKFLDRGNPWLFLRKCTPKQGGGVTKASKMVLEHEATGRTLRVPSYTASYACIRCFMVYAAFDSGLYTGSGNVCEQAAPPHLFRSKHTFVCTPCKVLLLDAFLPLPFPVLDDAARIPFQENRHNPPVFLESPCTKNVVLFRKY